MIRWREERRRSFRAIAALLVAMLTAGFVEVVARLVLAAALANTVAAITFVVVLAVLVFRLAGRERSSGATFSSDSDPE